MKTSSFRWGAMGKRQKAVLSWWHPKSKYADYNGIIADGAIRSGKTVSMGFSFVLWAMTMFNGQSFGMCGKTIASFRRNVLGTLKAQLKARGYVVTDKRSENLLIISNGEKSNIFYIFGGKDEASQDLVQGVTLAGVFFDEVALMPESFVNQATARCSVKGSKFWFNCNPAGPFHWFYTGWICKHKKRKLLYLHFTMEDNLSLAEEIKERYRNQYVGVFYDRYIRGLWVLADGLIYPMYSNTVPTVERAYTKYVISMDYGIKNATAMILWGLCDGTWYAVKEYYHSGRETNQQKTDQQYYDELLKLAGDLPIFRLIVDPSAASFIALVEQERQILIWDAENAVLEGIQHTATCLSQKAIMINDCCKRTIQEFGVYCWDDKSNDDAPLKINDHAMDAVRYFVETMQIWRGRWLDNRQKG